MTGTSTETNDQEKTTPRIKSKKNGFSSSNRWLLALAVIYTLYFASSLLIPILVALLMALLLSPIVSLLKRLYIPRVFSALLILGIIGAPLGLLMMELAQPAQKWASRLPELNAFMNETLSELTLNSETKHSVESNQVEGEEQGFWSSLFGGDEEPELLEVDDKNGGEMVSDKIVESGMDALLSLLLATPLVIAQLIISLMLFLFLLIFGPKLFKQVSEVVSNTNEKSQTLSLIVGIRRHLSKYIMTVSLINFGLGSVTALTLYWLGVDDALLWGALAAVLNFAPYIGPFVLAGILTIAGIAQYGPELLALLPTSVYLVLNLIEAQFVTPVVLGRNMRLNPLVVLLWLIIWGWLWGAAGVLLAVPLLVCIKLVVNSLEISPSWTKVLESGV